MTDALRAEVAAAGVKVILVEPGLVRTGIWQEAEDELAGRTGSQFAASYRRLLTVTRLVDPIMGDPSKVASAIANAVTSHKPRTRYLVGYDAQTIAALQAFVPIRIRDRIARTLLDL